MGELATSDAVEIICIYIYKLSLHLHLQFLNVGVCVSPVV